MSFDKKLFEQDVCTEITWEELEMCCGGVDTTQYTLIDGLVSQDIDPTTSEKTRTSDRLWQQMNDFIKG